MKDRYTVAVIGGGSGGRLSMKAASSSERYRLAAVADVSQVARREVEGLFPNVNTFADHETMLRECPTDVVVVATWPPSHPEVAHAALQLPLTGIVVEKPLADSYARGAELLQAIAGANLPLVVPHGLRVVPHGREILDLVRGGEIGDLILAEIECSGWDIINAGIHWMNFVVALLEPDPIVQVMAQCDTSSRTYRDGMQVETDAVTYAVSRAGVRVVMHTGDYVPIAEVGEGTLFRLVGKLGLIEFYGWKSCYRIVSRRYPEGRKIDVAPPAKSAHHLYLDRLAAQMDGAGPDYSIPRSSLVALEIVEAAYLSHRHQCSVSLPLSGSWPTGSAGWTPGIAYSGADGGRNGRRLG